MGENQRQVFVKNLRHYMERRGVDQSDIVVALGVSASTVSDWFNGKKYPRVDAMQMLSDYLGVLISDLTSEKPAPAPFDELTTSEAELLEIYRSLNEIGRQALIGTARGLAANPDMKKGGLTSGATA